MTDQNQLMREALESYEHAIANGHREHDALSAFDGISVPDLVRRVLAAPQAPADVVRDAERYRWLRQSPIANNVALACHFGGSRMQDFDAAIDAAMSTKVGGV